MWRAGPGRRSSMACCYPGRPEAYVFAGGSRPGAHGALRNARMLHHPPGGLTPEGSSIEEIAPAVNSNPSSHGPALMVLLAGPWHGYWRNG